MTAEEKLFPRAMALACHELLTPVTVVSGYLRMLIREQGGPLTDKQRKMLEEAEKSANRIRSIVAEMRELAKLVGGEVALGQQDFDLAALLAELASGMHEGEDRGVRLELRGVDQPIEVTGDKPRLAAALKALMHSVLRERGEPGVIVVDCSVRHDASRTWAVVAIGDGALVNSVANSGDKPADGFGDEWRGGLGMALPVARRVIEGHGGQLWSIDGTQSRAASALRIPLRT
jgi:signal transduction histidine kinase